jgi:hypothetical protein
MPEERRRKVVAIGNGRYRVTTVIEVDEAQLLALGLQPPPEDLPWAQPAPFHAADKAAALQYWTEHLGGHEPRLAGLIVSALKEFGIAVVKQTIDQLAAQNIKGGASRKYFEFVRVLRQVRERRDGK